VHEESAKAAKIII